MRGETCERTGGCGRARRGGGWEDRGSSSFRLLPSSSIFPLPSFLARKKRADIQSVPFFDIDAPVKPESALASKDRALVESEELDSRFCPLSRVDILGGGSVASRSV